jgi:hypothetical protein
LAEFAFALVYTWADWIVGVSGVARISLLLRILAGDRALICTHRHLNLRKSLALVLFRLVAIHPC